MRSALVLGLLCSLACAAYAATRLGDIDITEDKQAGIKNCSGGVATVSSNKNALTFKNCSKVVVQGNKNTIALEGCKALEVPGNSNTVKAGVVKSLNTMGNKNTVTYKLGPKKEKPSISNLGNENTIKAE